MCLNGKAVNRNPSIQVTYIFSVKRWLTSCIEGWPPVPKYTFLAFQ